MQTTEYIRLVAQSRAHVSRYNFGSTLLVGGGRTTWTYAALLDSLHLCTKLAVLQRPSCNGNLVRKELKQQQGRITAGFHSTEQLSYELQNKLKFQAECCPEYVLEGQVDELYYGYESLVNRESDFNCIFVCTPNNDYSDVVATLIQLGVVTHGTTLVLVSSRIGATSKLCATLNPTGCVSVECNVITAGQYFAATRFRKGSRTNVETDAVKTQVPMWFQDQSHPHSRAYQQLLDALGVHALTFTNPLEAEIRTSNLFVHPPLALNPVGLERLFDTNTRSFLYRLFPEGVITAESFYLMAGIEDDVNSILESCGFAPLNLLVLLTTMYPVPEELVSQIALAEYAVATVEKRAFLLSMAFWGRQVDPAHRLSNDTTEYTAHYRNFMYETVSECPYSGVYTIPRNPYEDYESLLLLLYFARERSISVPTIELLCRRFETATRKFEKTQSVKTNVSFDVCHCDAQVALKYMGTHSRATQDELRQTNPHLVS